MAEAETSLGKRKEREDDSTEPRKGTTIFVSNLPYSATSTDLNTLFSDLGPVRSAFVVLDQSTGSSKGVGYVSFAIKEDAQLAFDKVNEDGTGILLDRRKLRAAWPDTSKHMHRDTPRDPNVKREPNVLRPETTPKQPKQPTGPKDPLAIRTVVVSGLPGALDSNTLWKKMRKYAGAEKAEWPVKKDDVEDPSIAHVLFTTPATASEAVNKLHAHVFKGSLLSVTLKKRMDGLAKPTAQKQSKKPKQENGEGEEATPSTSKRSAVPAPTNASRLIVRNLPWNITEQDLRSVFLPYGPIHSIHIPAMAAKAGDVKAEDRTTKQRMKGYAFVWMLSKKDAENAIEGANGTKVSAGMADALVRDKQKKKKLRREEKKIKEKEKARREKKAAEGGEGEDEEEEDDEEAEGTHDSDERVIAVDWALSKAKWEEAKTKIQEDEAEAAGEDGDEDEESESSGSESEGSDGSHIGVHDGDGSEDDEDEDEDNQMDVDENPGRPTLPPPETGTTLFVRNVPFEATDDELRTVFRAFGPLRYARITMEHDTGRSRGTGFVCFWNIADADKAVEQSEILRAETTGEVSAVAKKNPFKLPSLLTPDPSASVAKSLVLHGRSMDVIRAVTRDEAGKLKEAGERQREKADKRNVYLLREGTIIPNTPAAATISAADLEKRTASFNARRTLLRSNPSLYVSKTRLSVRQLPLFATERMLKRLAIHACRSFQAEFKAKKRVGLTEDELLEPEDEDENGEPIKQEKGKPRAKGRNTGVKQSKVVRQHDRVDPVTGKGRSRGYAFLEMHSHADALRVLRWANNNAEIGALFEEWWKEEVRDLIKAEKTKSTEDGRLERLKKELEERGKKPSKGTLIVEFSIENVQVVKRRAAFQQVQKDGPTGTDDKRSQRRSSKTSVKTEVKDEERPQKKPRVSKPDSKAAASASSDAKPGANLGSLIGRKRKERKGKKGKS
ncbi:hypothetical protein EUX98_g3202 [Antrodiella citrinella]|uniref:RRM domain-containing protein n=1 Tax=Antrodiella citrinella TaxID=2447956 RepID=A0A4S4MYC2_9APHY|nr:hypothetical protein EUX98_g3202 [Antrodiella citrinella]